MDSPPRSRAPVFAIVGGIILLLLCVGIVPAMGAAGVLAAIGIPNFVAFQLKAKRSEVPANVDSIRIAELAYRAGFDQYAAAGSESEAARSLTPDAHPWVPSADFDRIAWRPDSNVRGGYWVVLVGDGFEVHGIIDADGDGVPAHYVATEESGAVLVTDQHTY
jgi:type II secretory pathway pseudopilin PulG